MRSEYPVGFDEVVRESFRYDPVKGLMERKKWMTTEWVPVTAKHPQGHFTCNVRVNGRNWIIPAQRLAFFIQEKRWPGMVRFKNGDPTDLRWENLFEQVNKPVVLERVSIGRTPSQPAQPGQPAQLTQAAEKKKLTKYWGNVLKGEKREGDPLSTGLFVDGGARELNPTEMYEVHQQMQREEELEDDRLLTLIAQCHPVFEEMRVAVEAYRVKREEFRRTYGLWTECTLSDMYSFLAEANKVCPPIDLETCIKEKCRMMETGEFSDLPKWEQDRWQATVWQRCLQTRLYAEWEISEKLRDYRFNDEKVPPLPDEAAKVQQAVLEQHGFKSLAEASAAAYERFTAKQQEDKARLEKLEGE